MLVTLPNIAKITLSTLWLTKVKGHGPPNLTVSSSCYKFSKIFKPRHGFIFWYFLLIFGRMVADKIIFYLRKFYCKILKDLWDTLGQTWHKMKKTRKVGYLCCLGYPWLQWKFALKKFSHIHCDMTSLSYKIHEWSQFFIEKKFDEACEKTTNFVVI